MRPPITIVPASPDPDTSVAQTVGVMAWCIRQAVRHPAVLRATRAAIAQCSLNDPAWRKAEAVWQWVHSNIQFMSDEEILARYFGLPQDLELLQRPELLLSTRKGDCDCFTMLTCAMLQCAGVQTHIVTIAADQSRPGQYSHVFAIAVDEAGREIPMDTSHGRYFRWQAPNYTRRQEWAS